MSLFFSQKDRILNASGAPVVNGYIYIGEYGQDAKTNLITIYSDEALTIPLANPQRTDTYGQPENDIYLGVDHSYKFENSNDVYIDSGNRRISTRADFETAQSLDLIILSETSANNYEINEGWNSVPPNGMYMFKFAVNGTTAPTITFNGLSGSYASSGVDSIDANATYSAKFDGSVFKLSPMDVVVDPIIYKGIDLANGYKDENNPSENKIVLNRLGVSFPDGAIQPIGYGTFQALTGDGYRLKCSMPTAEDNSGESKHKNLSLRFVDESNASITLNGETEVGVITKTDFDVPIDTSTFTVEWLNVIPADVVGRWEIQSEAGSTDNHSGELFCYEMEVIRA